MRCNNAIICTVLRINRRYFTSKKDSVEIFNVYMQEVNLKFYNFPFILFTFLFRVWCMHRKYQLQDLWSCALAWSCQKHNPSSHTRISYFFNTSLITFLFTPPSIHTWHRNEAKRPTFVEFCSSIPIRVIFSSLFFTMGNWEFLHCIPLLRQEKSNCSARLGIRNNSCLSYHRH